MANEEPLVVVETRVDIVWEVVREDGGDSRGSVVWKGKAALHRGGCRSVHEGSFGAEDRDVGRDRRIGSHWGSEVFASRGGNEDIVGVNSDVLVKRGKEESVEDFLGDLGRSGRHRGRGVEADQGSLL